jgi:hypothetical protein
LVHRSMRLSSPGRAIQAILRNPIWHFDDGMD